MKKFVSVLLALMLAVCMLAFTGCDTVMPTLEKADQALRDAPYTVTVDMNFACDNAELNTIFDALSMEIPMTVDGDNLSLDMTLDVLGSNVGYKMSVVDKVLYASVDMGILGETKMKATLNDDQFKDFMSENAAELPVDYLQFGELKSETKDGKQIITCSDITNAGLSALNKEISDALTGVGADAAVGEISFVITLADGKYESMALSCAYSITMNGETYTVSLTTNAKYTYENVEKVTAPADADSYEEVGYDQIAG